MGLWLLWGALSVAIASEPNPKPDTSESNDTTTSSDADTAYAEETESGERPYVFGWLDYPHPSLALRGGTTTGTPVTLATEPSAAWTALRADDLSPQERDRRAILAIAGDYRASFDFLESEVYGDIEGPASPYRSWGTERVYVVEDSENVISLQHLMVMFFIDQDGVEHGPMVMKHWRQDWVYEPTTALEFIGDQQWENRPVPEAEQAGHWQQTVYQVDDSPRYAMRGTWTHNASFSAWQSTESWRPLPRREHSVRSDYHALVGTNRITVLPRGWIHDQDNVKTVLSGPGVIDTANPAVGREIGLNRYDQLVDFDFSAGDTYWEATADYWGRVRAGWDARLSTATRVRVEKMCEDQLVFAALMGLAQEIAVGDKRALKKQDQRIDEILDCVVTPLP